MRWHRSGSKERRPSVVKSNLVVVHKSWAVVYDSGCGGLLIVALLLSLDGVVFSFYCREGFSLC